MSLCILHTADSHIGADLPVRGGATRPRRGEDFVDSHRRVLALARATPVDLVLHCGDLFDTPQPTQSALAAACAPLVEVAAAGIPVVIVPGNHERSILPANLLLTHANIHILHVPRTVVLTLRGHSVAIAGFPCLRRTAAARFAEAVAATGAAAVRADLRILAVHEAFEGARCGPANFRFRAGDDVVPRADVPESFDYIAAGHVHRHQVLEGGRGTPVVYCGSPDRITFAEIGEPKGAVLVECDARGVRPRFVEHRVRPMETFALDVTGLTASAARAEMLAKLRIVPNRAVVRIRLSGQATRSGLRGLCATQAAREVRPDVLAGISSQAIEWVPERVAARRAVAPLPSAFDALNAPAADIVRVASRQARDLPASCGTYALYDGQGRLLYVGKSAQVRARVRTHLRGDSPNGFANWSSAVARIEVRPAGSELEALLVEADLIRQLAPPFNLQMRRWKRYCYLCDGADPFGQLRTMPEPRGTLCFGPVRSTWQAEELREVLARTFGLALCPAEPAANLPLLPAGRAAQACARHFAGLCAAPCTQAQPPAAYRAALAQRNALLAGEQPEMCAAWRAELDALEQQATRERLATAEDARRRVLQTLLALAEHAQVLRAARTLMNRLLLLPGGEGEATVALVTGVRLHLEKLRATPADAERIVAWRHRVARRPAPAGRPVLPKPVADVLCVAARELTRGETHYRAVPDDADAVALLAAVRRR